MPHTRYSALTLWLKYVNREPRVSVMCVGLLFGTMLSPFLLFVAFGLRYVVAGESAQATVVSKHQARARQPARTVAAVSPLFAHGKRGPRYVVHYRFLDAAGIEHKGEGRVSVAFWQGTKAGDQVAVRYLRGDPASSKLESAVWEFWPAIPVAVLSPVVLAYALRLGGSGIRWVNRQVWLVRHGDAVPGRFTRAEVEYRGKRRKDAVCVLEYEYAAPELVTGNLEMREKPRPEWQTGAGLVILVDPWDPMSHAPDIFDARSADADRLFPNPAAVT